MMDTMIKRYNYVSLVVQIVQFVRISLNVSHVFQELEIIIIMVLVIQ
jgi:hypothetical protein